MHRNMKKKNLALSQKLSILFLMLYNTSILTSLFLGPAIANGRCLAKAQRPSAQASLLSHILFGESTIILVYMSKMGVPGLREDAIYGSVLFSI